MVRCNLCNQELGRITETHLWHKHKIHFPKFIKLFPEVNIGPMPWNKGDTKATNLSLSRLSDTLRTKKEWNFSKWQREKSRQQKIQYKELIKNGNLTELIGIILGDGNLYKHPRTENLRITCNSKDTYYILHTAHLIEKIFDKKPSIVKRKNKKAVSINLYQNKISERLGIPLGDKIKNNVGIPFWIFSNHEYTVRCLKGLFETDGCFVEDKDNYTQIIEFKNYCRKLREDVYSLLCKLGYHPQFGKKYIRLARREEVFNFKNLIDFRNY